MLNAPPLRGDGYRLIRVPGADRPTFRESDLPHFLHFGIRQQFKTVLTMTIIRTVMIEQRENRQ
jgi:hypothetical protein